MRRRRLLVIDDDRALLFAFRKLFRKTDIDVDTCESLEEAKRLIDITQYPVILTDLRFSDVVEEAGIVISAYAKDKNPAVKVILWTAAELSGISEKARAARIDFCFVKPVSPGVIQGIVKSLFEAFDLKSVRRRNSRSSAPALGSKPRKQSCRAVAVRIADCV